MLKKWSALWNGRKERSCKVDSAPSTSGDKSPTKSSGNATEPCALSAVSVKKQQSPLRLFLGKSRARSHRSAGAQGVEHRDASPSSMQDGPVCSNATGDTNEVRRLPSISGPPPRPRSPPQQKQAVKDLSAFMLRTPSDTSSLLSPSERQPKTASLVALNKVAHPPRANVKAPVRPPRAIASAPTTTHNERSVSGWSMLNHIKADDMHTLEHCLTHGSLDGNTETDACKSPSQPHTSPLYSMLQVRRRTVPQLSLAPKGSGEAAPHAFPWRRTESTCVKNNVNVHQPEAEDDPHEAMLYASAFMNDPCDEKMGTISDAGGGTAMRDGRKKNSALLRTLRPPRRVSETTTASADAPTATNRNSSGATGSTCLAFPSIFMTTSYAPRYDLYAEMYGGTVSHQDVAQRAGILSLPDTTSDSVTPPVSMTSWKGPKRIRNEGSTPKEGLGERVIGTEAEVCDILSVNLKHVEENPEASVCDQTVETAPLHRVNQLAKSQWKYVAHKLLEKKTLTKISRERSLRFSSIYGDMTPHTPSRHRLHEVSAGSVYQNSSFAFDDTTASHYTFDIDVEEESAYATDGRALLIPNVSGIWADLRSSSSSSSSSSDDSLVFGEADAFTADDNAARNQNEGESHVCATRRSPPSEAKSVPDPSHDQTPLAHLLPTPPAVSGHRQQRQQAPQARSLNSNGGGMHNDYNGKANLYPVHKGHPDPQVPEHVKHQRVTQRHQQVQQRHHIHSLTAASQKHAQRQSPLFQGHQQGQSRSTQTCLNNRAKRPWPQPDIYKGPKVYTGRLKSANGAELGGIRLTDVPRVNSPCWSALKLADQKRRLKPNRQKP
ncbi:hypothetical protein, unknown function [Leishmania tarentolae]|uniref:Uncharacterized protein n=1 Tax=Leishmania tarentolae TaxID=5689 RepID=A0A640KUL4_LEITA|nr:hypothetical protein, unknown function [Leishmania tarentolae]